MELLPREKAYRRSVLFASAAVVMPASLAIAWPRHDARLMVPGTLLGLVFAIHGLLVTRMSSRANTLVAIVSSAALAVTVSVISSLTDGSRSMVFGVLWVMPFSFVLLFPRDGVVASAGGLTALVVGTTQMILEKRPAAEIFEWSGLCACFCAFGGGCAVMLERTLTRQLRETSEEFTARLRAERAQQELQSRLAMSDRLASVGTLAAGVAHELNNPLAYITANLDYSLEVLAGEGKAPDVLDALKDARQGADRMRVIIKDLKTFSRGDEATLGPVELSEVIESCIGMAWNELRHRAQLEKDFESGIYAQGNEARLAQVFLNLIVNAAQAIPAGNAAMHSVRIVTRSTPQHVIIEVSDTGVGIPQDNLRRIFDPFFTTKEVGVGTGLGLSIVHNIVRDHGGSIEVDSEVRRGTTFRVTLPRTEPAEDSGAFPMVIGEYEQRRKLLVVDDDAQVGSAIKRALGNRHDVTVVQSGEEALALFQSNVRPEAILCDLMMPDMTGMALFDRVAARFPELKTRMIFMTGGAFTSESRAFVSESRQPLLEKPLDAGVLKKALRKIRDRELPVVKAA